MFYGRQSDCQSGPKKHAYHPVLSGYNVSYVSLNRALSDMVRLIFDPLHIAETTLKNCYYREPVMPEIIPAELLAQLDERKAELSERIARIKADIGRGLDADSKEQATQLENKEVLDALANEATDELAKVNAALQRIQNGTYGICTACGTAIDSRRLAVRPYSSKCISCAS